MKKENTKRETIEKLKGEKIEYTRSECRKKDQGLHTWLTRGNRESVQNYSKVLIKFGYQYIYYYVNGAQDPLENPDEYENFTMDELEKYLKTINQKS